MAKQNVYLTSKPRYEILDGLRGVAALMVIFFHCFETYSWKSGVQIIDHGYLAVDFFFILSGFVVGYAYDDRWDKMTTWGFIKRRLVRLHPMVVMGTIIGVIFYCFRNCSMCPVTNTNGWTFLLAFVMCLLMIPCGTAMGKSLNCWDEFNPFNGPIWSLSFEYVANILYALVFRRLPKAVLAILCAIFAFFTLDLLLGWNVTGIPTAEQFTVIGGWSLSVPHAHTGFVRLLYPFVCGLLISRILSGRMSESNPSGSPLHAKGGFWWCALILIVVLSIPRVSHSEVRGVADGLYQAIAIIAVFPLVVMLGAGSKLTDSKSAKICKFLGDISFPLYAIHYPIMYCQMAWVLNNPDAPLWMNILLNVSVVVLSVGIAWACLKLYDEPVRKWLTEHWLKRNKLTN